MGSLSSAFFRFALLSLVLCAGALGLHAQGSCPSSPPTGAVHWNAQWCDEFDGAAGTPIDSTKWLFERGDLHVNNELEWYCGPAGDPSNQFPCDQNPGGASNVYLDGSGNLVIQAFRISPDTGPSTKAWTSARLNTSNNLASFQYGRIESRMKLPIGPGIWPAFWALGTNITTVGWPNCGEIDYMENVPASSGLGPNVISSTLHGPTYNGANGQGKKYTIPANDPNGPDVTSYHVYGAIWSPNLIQFYVDDPANIFFVRTADDVPGGAPQWAYNHSFFLLLNLAVGGTGSWPGPPDGTTPSPAVMSVDWVRAYQAAQVLGPTMTAAGGITVKAGASGSATVNLSSTTGSGLVYLSCSGAPAKSTCTIDTGNALSPHVADFRNSGTATATVDVTTTANTAQAVPSRSYSAWASVIGIVGMFALPFARRNSARIFVAVGMLGLFLTASSLLACGGGSSFGGGGGGSGGGTPTGHHVLTVTATTVSGDSSTANVSLDVN